MIEAGGNRDGHGGEASRPDSAQADAAGVPDGVEIWARRVGRFLGWSAAAIVLIYLLRIYAP